MRCLDCQKPTEGLSLCMLCYMRMAKEVAKEPLSTKQERILREYYDGRSSRR